MARNTAPEDEPTSNWDHSHAVQEGDVYRVDYFGVDLAVVEVQDDGSIVGEMRPDGRDGEIEQEYTEEEVTTALSDSLWERDRDGKSHELATF